MIVNSKVAIVTGGAQGLGRGYAEALLRKGAKVCICDINSKQGEATLREFHNKFGSENSTFVRCDVTDRDSLEAVFMKVLERFGGVDIVVNNAGVGGEDPSTWRRTIMINTIGVIEGTMLATQHMSLENGGRGGVVINISSTAGLTPVFTTPVYVASKYGVVGYTRSVAANPEVRKLGIRYTCLCPAFTYTAMFTESDGQNEKISSLVKDTGVNSLESVVNAFMILVESDNNNGAVMAISVKRGIEYRHGKPMHKL